MRDISASDDGLYVCSAAMLSIPERAYSAIRLKVIGAPSQMDIYRSKKTTARRETGGRVQITDTPKILLGAFGLLVGISLVTVAIIAVLIAKKRSVRNELCRL